MVYATPPAKMDFTEPLSIPPGEVSSELYHHLDRLLERAFPGDIQAVIRASSPAEVSVQPIYDRRVDSYGNERVLLIGDAGAVCRPHTASGAAKALQDARCLERLGREYTAWDDLFSAYGAERSTAGTALVEMGRPSDGTKWSRRHPGPA